MELGVKWSGVPSGRGGGGRGVGVREKAAASQARPTEGGVSTRNHITTPINPHVTPHFYFGFVHKHKILRLCYSL